MGLSGTFRGGGEPPVQPECALLREPETGTVQDNKPTSKEQNNTISSTKESKPKKKRKPFDIRVDSQNSLKESKNKFKNTYSTESLK